MNEARPAVTAAMALCFVATLVIGLVCPGDALAYGWVANLVLIAAFTALAGLRTKGQWGGTASSNVVGVFVQTRPGSFSAGLPIGGAAATDLDGDGEDDVMVALHLPPGPFGTPSDRIAVFFNGK